MKQSFPLSYNLEPLLSSQPLPSLCVQGLRLEAELRDNLSSPFFQLKLCYWAELGFFFL